MNDPEEDIKKASEAIVIMEAHFLTTFGGERIAAIRHLIEMALGAKAKIRQFTERHADREVALTDALLAVSSIDEINKFRRHLVDVTWKHATESTNVPFTNVADKLIALALDTMPK